MHHQPRRAEQRQDPKYNIETVSDIYTNVNGEKGPQWYDVSKWPVEPVSPDGYEIIDWIGTGKYSDVFTAVKGDKEVAIKVLKPVREEKYFREAKILSNLRGGPNIIQLLDIVKNPQTDQHSFVFEYINDEQDGLTREDCKLYFYQLLRALQYSHSHGIMHRDVKPLNIMYDKRSKVLKLIDWGLADFYHPKKNYNIHVASRHYKPPELLLDYQLYDYSVDLWSFGVTMATILFKKSPFFNGSDDYCMVEKIVKILGGAKFREYVEKYNLPVDKEQRSYYRYPKRNWSDYRNETELVTDDALDLIDKCLRYDHKERITAEEALKHPYFDDVRDFPFPG